MAKLTKAQSAQIASLGIKADSLEAAIEKMVAFLKTQELDGVEGESFENLVLFCEAFAGDNPANAEPSEEDENEALAREVVEEDDDDDEEETIVAPVKKPMKPSPPQPAPSAAKPVPAKKPAVALAVPATGTKFDGRGTPAHGKLLAFLYEFFPQAEQQWDFLKNGVTIRAMLENTRPTVLNFDEVRINPDNTLSGNVYFNKFKSVEDLEKFLPVGYGESHRIGMFRGESHPSIKALTQAEIIELFSTTGVVTETFARVGKLDGKMGANRVKMEESLKSERQKSGPAKPAAKKK